MSGLSKKDTELVEAVLQTMAEDLAELVEVYGLGACMVRAIQQDKGRVLMVAKAHGRQLGGLSAPQEFISIRKEARQSD